MKKSVLILLLTFVLFSLLWAQKVGLIFSGGGAKGVTHIGVLKALEENNIPVDYIAGTSMGAIVGSMYAMGYTPDEILELIKSNDFKYWSSGEIETDYVYFYRNGDLKPDFVKFNFSMNKLDSLDIRSEILPTNVVSPHQMNFAFVHAYSQANALCKGNFDSLFVPFRCVASDIYRKESVVFRSGVLGDVIRASMTFPFMFKPIKIENKLLFDGGIYNNFPIDVMRNDFKPDFMIGSVTSQNPEKPNEQDVLKQLENMIMSQTKYEMPVADGILLKFDLKTISTFDFSKVDELFKMGQDSVLKHLAEIKARVPRTVSITELTERRKAFRIRLPKMIFQEVKVEGVDSLQKNYIENTFHRDNLKFDLKEFKQAYFKLISDDKISEVIPHASYNQATGLFNLVLDVRIEDHFKVLFGGNLSSTNANQAYVGLSFQTISKYAHKTYFDAHFGRIYNGIGLGTRIDIPAQRNWHLKFALNIHKFDYFEGDMILYEDNRTANFTQSEMYSKLSVGFPITMKGRLEIGAGAGILKDKYLQNSGLNGIIEMSDKSTFTLANAFVKIESNTLNHSMYATKGYKYSTSLQLFGGEERFDAAENNLQIAKNKMNAWLQFRGKMDRYYHISPRFNLGAWAELIISNRKLLHNYTVSLIQSPSFHPTPHSRTVFNPAFCANQFASVGIKPIYNITKNLHMRTEAYGFVPYKTIYRLPDNLAAYNKPYKSAQYLLESSLVYDFKVVSAALFANYYSSAYSQWNFGLNIGFLLFNPKFME